jgi:hypothetical protein
LPEATESPDATAFPLEAIASVIVVETGGFAAEATCLADNDIMAMSPATNRARGCKTGEKANMTVCLIGRRSKSIRNPETAFGFTATIL